MTGSPDDQIAGPSPPPTKPRFGPHWIALGSVLVMLLFITVGLPYLIRPRSASREVNFVVSLRTINTACVTYSYTYPKRGFPPSLSALGPPQGNAALSAAAADLIDLRLANTGQKSGYRFTYRPFDHDGDGRY